jgi:SNF2 family DNA or RNA helicase
MNDFTKIFRKAIVLHKTIDDNNLRLIFGEYKKLYIIDTNDIPDRAIYDEYINLYNIPKTEYLDPLVRFYYYYGDYIVYPYLNYMSIDEMKREPFKIISKNNYFIKEGTRNYKKASLYAKIERVNDDYFMTYYINNNILSNITNNINKVNLLTSILISQKGIDIINDNNNFLKNILTSQPINTSLNILCNDERLLRSNISLYNYQIDDINWMKTIEKSILENNNMIEYKSSLAYEVSKDLIIYNNTLLPKEMSTDLLNSSVINKSFKYYGGNLISEVGLGKTVIALYHILSDDKFTNNWIRFTDNCNYFYKRGNQKGNVCKNKSNPGELYCNVHKDTMFIDKRYFELCNLDNFDIRDWIINNRFIRSNATLILCPNHVCDQWIKEYYSKFKNKHNVLLIVTYDQYMNITLADLLFADIIVMSYNFLTNKRYLECFKNNIDLKGQFFDNGFDIDNKDINVVNLLNSKKFSIFHLFHWNRIILDEAHEIENINNNKLSLYITYLSSNYKWNISATPFANNLSSFIRLMSYNTSYNSIKNTLNYDVYTTENLIDLGLHSDIVTKCNVLFRRNTKESIKNEWVGNILREHVNLLDFTTQERSIYDSYKHGSKSNYYNFLIKLCCHPELNNDTKEMIKNCKTFDEIHKSMVIYNKNLLERELVRIKKIESEISHYNIEINKIEEPYTDSDKETVDELRLRLNVSKRQLTLSKKSHDEISRTYNYLKSSVETLKNSEEEITCPICLDDIDTSNLTITKCGHKFCWDCIYETHQIQKQNNIQGIKCPTCNLLINNTELYLLSKDQNIYNSINSDLQTIIQNVKSTKIGNIIHFLKTLININSSDKIILFSQWDELLHKVGGILSSHGLKIVYCNGSVYKKKKAIDSFCKDPDINLILLSSRNAASGINLTIANKIIFLEPIYGNKEYRQDIETQAIGRADRLGQKNPIDIYRFIIKDTIEEDIYKNCIDDSQLEQLTL